MLLQIKKEVDEMEKINKEKLQKALDTLEMKANYINAEYYYPRFQKLLKLSKEVF